MREYKERIFSYALRLLVVRPRSERELERRLRIKFPEDGERITEVIGRLRKLGYLNDREFTRMWIEERIRMHPEGREKIRRELRDKGVSRELIDELLEELYPPDKEREVMEELGRRKWERDAGVEVRKRKERVYRYLLYRGFPVSWVNQFVSSLK